MFALSSWFREGQLPNSPRPQGGMWTKGVGTKGQRPDLKTPGPTPSCRKEGGREGGKERPAIVPSPTLPGRWRLELVHPVPGGGLCPQLPPFFAQQVPRAWVCLQGAPWLHLCPGWLGLLVTNSSGLSICGSGPRTISHCPCCQLPSPGMEGSPCARGQEAES